MTISASLPGSVQLGRSDALEDMICLSHLRWNFVFQRPQHLLTRCARERRVFFFEEPVFDAEVPRLDLTRDASGVFVAVPHITPGSSASRTTSLLRGMLDELMAIHRVSEYVLWYYTPMALGFTDHLSPRAVVYDCMDELSAFAGAPAGLRSAERELLRRCDLVTTGGVSLYEAKRRLHHNVHAFPSSVDVAHFARARAPQEDPTDQGSIARPRLGYVGVIDERLDVPLLAEVAARRPDWQIVVIGPVVKIDPATLPRLANIHYLGSRAYSELPAYIAGWDVALLPFARNAATRFISPTKTPEYLAAGRPVVSTSIRDVVHPYGTRGLVRIADRPEEFVAAIEAALAEDPEPRLAAADAHLADMSWDTTWQAMHRLLQAAVARRAPRLAARAQSRTSSADFTHSPPATA